MKRAQKTKEKLRAQAMRGALTDAQYHKIWIGKSYGKDSREIAGLTGLNLREINYAYCSPTYELYLRERRVRRRGIWGDDHQEEPKAVEAKRGRPRAAPYVIGKNEFGVTIIDEDVEPEPV